MIRSHQRAQAGERALRARLAQAQAAVAALHDRRRGKRRLTQLPALQEAVAAILARCQGQGWRRVSDEAQVRRRLVRRYGSRPATMWLERDMHVTASVDAKAVAAAVHQLGWRGYAAHQPVAQLALAQAVLAYRSAYLMERDMGRLKGQPLSLTPMDLERADHVTGLIRLLVSGLRVLTRLGCVVRRRLAPEWKGLAGLYTGNPKRATARSTAERLLASFQELTLTIIRAGRRRRSHLTPLSAGHQRILSLLDCSVDIDTRRCADSRQLPSK